MKRTIKLLFLILSIVSIFLIYKYNYKKNINYTSLGDGLSLGIDSYENKDYGYSDYIKDYLENKGILNLYTKEYASKEMSIKQLITTILIDKKVYYQNKKINIKNIISESDIITLSIGLNDLIYKMSINDINNINKIKKIVDEVYSEFNNLINELRKYTTKDIYVIGYYENDYYDYKLNYAINQLNYLYSQNEEVTYIATDYLLNNNKKYLENPRTYYPNREGYQVISSKIIEKISKKLEK